MFNETKLQLRRPAISTLVDLYTQLFKYDKPLAKYDSLKIQNVSNIHFEKRVTKKNQKIFTL